MASGALIYIKTCETKQKCSGIRISEDTSGYGLSLHPVATSKTIERLLPVNIQLTTKNVQDIFGIAIDENRLLQKLSQIQKK